MRAAIRFCVLLLLGGFAAVALLDDMVWFRRVGGSSSLAETKESERPTKATELPTNDTNKIESNTLQASADEASTMGLTEVALNAEHSGAVEISSDKVEISTKEPGRWIPISPDEKEDYLKKEAKVCGHPFQHCCIGQSRQLGGQHHNKSELFVKWSTTQGNLTTLLEYMHQHDIPCNLWFVGGSLNGDHMVAAMCELMREGYQLNTTSCTAYDNSRWAEGNLTNCSISSEKDLHQAYYELYNPSADTCPSVSVSISGWKRPTRDQTLHGRPDFTSKGGVVVWNHGVHCNDPDTCIGPTLNETLLQFLNMPESKPWYVLYRETERQHFKSSNGYYPKRNWEHNYTCVPIAQPDDEDDWRNVEARSFLSQHAPKMPIIPLAHATKSLHFMHGLDPDRRRWDCTHYSYSPWRFHITWEGMRQGLKQLVHGNEVGN